MKRTAPFSKAAIRNACIAAAFALPPVGFVGLAAIGNAVGPAEETKTAQAAKPAANKGTQGMSDYEACLYNHKQLADIGVESGYDCEGVKNYTTPAQRIAAAGGQSKLVRSCERYFRSSLKDPGSYRYQGSNVTATADNLKVEVRYTATNSFGGRIQDVQTCTFKG